MTSPQVDEQRLEQFRADVANLKIKSSPSRGSGVLRGLSIVLMIAGIVGAFAVYVTSLSKSDSRDIESSIILSVAFLTLAVLGAAVYIGSTLSSMLRLWLLRQLYEGQSHVDQITAALRERGI